MSEDPIPTGLGCFPGRWRYTKHPRKHHALAKAESRGEGGMNPIVR